MSKLLDARNKALDDINAGKTVKKIRDQESELESLRQQLAECQATNGKLRSDMSLFLDSHEECEDFDGFTAQIVSMDDYHKAQEALALPNDATVLNELIAERTKELTAEVERLKGEQYVQLDINTDDTRTKQQRELDGAMEVGQLLADSENSTASNSAFKGTEHLTWVHIGNGYISDSSGRFIGAFSGDFRNRDRFICAVNSENQLRQQNAELTAQRDALLAFSAAYVAAWNNGSTGDSDIFFMAESAIANCKEPGK